MSNRDEHGQGYEQRIDELGNEIREWKGLAEASLESTRKNRTHS